MSAAIGPMPYLDRVRTVAELLAGSIFCAPHFGCGLLPSSGEYGGYPANVGFLAPALLGRVSTTLLAIGRRPGNNLLAHYTVGRANLPQASTR